MRKALTSPTVSNLQTTGSSQGGRADRPERWAAACLLASECKPCVVAGAQRVVCLEGFACSDSQMRAFCPFVLQHAVCCCKRCRLPLISAAARSQRTTVRRLLCLSNNRHACIVFLPQQAGEDDAAADARGGPPEGRAEHVRHAQHVQRGRHDRPHAAAVRLQGELCLTSCKHGYISCSEAAAPVAPCS